MEATTFQQMLEQPPQLELNENSPILPARPNARKSQALPPHLWGVKKIRQIASDVRSNISIANGVVEMLEAFTAYTNEIGKHGLDLMFNSYSRERLENSLQEYDSYIKTSSKYADLFYSWDENWKVWIGNLKKRSDVPNKLIIRLEKSYKKIRSIRLRFEKARAILQAFNEPVRSSIILALANFRALTGEEKKVLLNSAVFSVPIDNPPSDSREDWYDDHGR